MSDHMTLTQRIRAHERMQQASGLISQVQDELPHGHPLKEQLRDLHHEVWERGYDMLGDVEDSGE